MTDLTALATKLSALIADDAAFAENGARIISQGAAPPALVAILNEVDNTVLERTLVFDLGEATISAVVAGRRMRGVVEMSGDVPGASDVVGEVLSREEPDTLKAAGALLTHLAEGAGTVTVRSEPIRPLGNSGDAGISASGLADVWGIDMDATPAPPMERFLSANAEAMTGLVHIIDDAVAETGGDSDVLQAIWDDQIADYRKRHAALKVKQDGPMLTCLDGAIAGDVGAALALVDNEVCLFSYDPAQLPGILGSWSAITA